MSRLPMPCLGSILLGFALLQPHAGRAQQVDLTTLTLPQAEGLLQAHNRELQAARRAVEAAGANTLSAGARPNPTLSLGVAAINPSQGVGGGAYWEKMLDTSVRIDQVIERGDRRELRLANAK